MTTFHEPPPQSRRAARESERAVQTDSAVDNTPLEESTTPPSGRRVRDEAAPTEEQQGFRVRDFSPEGRRSAAYPSQPAAPSNLDYRTQAGPAIEHPAEAQVPSWTPPASSVAASEPTGSVQPMTRREARALREAQDAAAAATPLVEPEQPTAAPTALTNAMAEFEALTRTAQPPVPEITEPPRTEAIGMPEPYTGTPEPYTTRIQGPSADSRVDDVPPPEGVYVEPVAVEPEPEAEPEPEEEPEPSLESGPIAAPISDSESFASLFSFPPPTAQPIPLVEPEPAPPTADPLAALFSPPPTEFAASPHPSSLFQQFETPTASEPEVDEADLVDEEPVAPSEEAAAASAWPFTAMQPTVPEQPAAESRAPEETLEAPISWTPPSWAAPTQDDSQPQPVLRETYTPPTGHWSRQADLDDENDVFENTLTREVGGSNVSTATSALILPNIPQASDFGSLINATGEILITGTIDLPQSLGTMGGDSRRYDDSSVDQMFEAFDGEVVSNDSAPVRAIRAVSTHTSSRGVIQTAKPQSNRMLLTAGIITVSVLVLGVIGLLAVYIITSL